MPVNTGVAGLDEVLMGGLVPFRLYLLEGLPGTGKTTIALQFLLEGKRLGENVLYVTLSENKEELHDVAESHGWSLDGVELYELEASQGRLNPEDEYTVFQPYEVELAETAQHVYDQVERIRPSRVVFDSLSEMRLLARDPLHYRRQILRLKQFFAGRSCTVLLLDDTIGAGTDLQLQSISHGVISLQRLGQEYGISRRRLQVVKLRGAKFRDGYHDYNIETGGVRVFPRLVAAQHQTDFEGSIFPSGISELDQLLGGGLNRGTGVLVTGPAGVGKSSLANSYLWSAAGQGLGSKVYIFEESRQTFLDRMAGIGMDVGAFVKKGILQLQQIDPAELSPGEFAQRLRQDVDHDGVQIIVIDSLNGYLNAMPNERFLLTQLHELLSYLSDAGALTILVAAQQGVIGRMETPVDVSYLVDTLILMRFFESRGALKKAISVVKNRKSAHEDTIREFQITSKGLRIGERLHAFRGVLRGVPEYTGTADELLNSEEVS